MFCIRCGQTIKEEDKFCPFCGAQQLKAPEESSQQPIENTQSAIGVNNTQQVPQQNMSQTGMNAIPPVVTKQKQPMNKNTKKALFGALGAVGVVVIGLLLFFLLKTSSIDMTKNATVTYSGADGYGYAYLENDVYSDPTYIKMQEELMKLYSSNMMNMNQKAMNKIMDYETIGNTLSGCYLTREDGLNFENGTLKNGDKLIVECAIPQEAKDAAKRQKISFKNTTKTFTVEGLQPVEEVDLFEGVSVNWAIEDGYVNLKVDASENKIANELGFEYDAYANGDGTATVQALVYEDELINYGYVAKGQQYEKKYDVGSEPVRVTSTTDDEVKKLAQATTDKLLLDDLDGCKYKLTEDDEEKAIKHEGDDIGFGFKRVYESWGNIYVEYTVVAGDTKVSRSYPVTVYKFSDGSYQVSTSYTAGNSSCKIIWGDSWQD